MNDTFHYLGIAIAMALIGIGVSLMAVPWLGSHALLFVPVAVAAVAAMVTTVGSRRGASGVTSGQLP